VWGETEKPSRRAMHEAVFEAGWDANALLPLYRQGWPRHIGAAGGKSSAWIGRTLTMSASPRFGG
jgi:hypothetical protein